MLIYGIIVLKHERQKEEKCTVEALKKQVEFIKLAEGLKSVEREAWTCTGRRESTAEHSWRLALFAGLLAPSFGADGYKAVMMSLIHDLGELYTGDIPAPEQTGGGHKYEAEKRDVQSVLSCLPEKQRQALFTLWLEYGENETPESKLVKALDKAETILQHSQGKNPPDFDYAFNLTYGSQYFLTHPLLAALREILDKQTRERMG